MTTGMSGIDGGLEAIEPTTIFALRTRRDVSNVSGDPYFRGVASTFGAESARRFSVLGLSLW